MSNIVTDYFAYKLNELGYPANDYTERYASGRTRTRPEIWWSLSNCQGDGVVFACNSPDMEKLIDRHLKGQQKTATRLMVDQGFKLKVVNRTHGPGLGVSRVECDDDPGFDDLTPFQKRAWADLERAVSKEVSSICSDLASEGYELLEAINPAWWGLEPSEFDDPSWAILRTYRTKRFVVEVKLVEDDDFNPYGDGWDDPHSTVLDMIAGKVIACGIVVTMKTDEGEELGRAALWSVTDDKDMKYIKSEARELAGKAIAEARQNLLRYAKGIRA